MPEGTISYLLKSEEPWTRYRTRVDLLGKKANDPDVIRDRELMIGHPAVKELVNQVSSWPGYPLKRHNDAKHPLHHLSVLADFGIDRNDPEMEHVISKILAHQSQEGAFETKIQLYKAFGGLEGEHWTWMSCDITVLLYALIAFGLGEDKPVRIAKNHLLSLVEENGWRCKSSPMLTNFRGPGKKDDPCPIVNLYALRALAMDPELKKEAVTDRGIEMLLHHWEVQGEKKYYLFGIGTDFRKLKYPLIWYDIIHVLDVLSRFPLVHDDPRYQDMLAVLADQREGEGIYKATSMYRAWKDWSFTDKKNPSPWLTFLIIRILKRSGVVKI